MFGRPILLRQYFGKIAHLQEELVTGLVPQRFVCERLALQFSVQLNLVSGIGKLFEIPFVEFKMKIVGYRVPDHAREEVPALRLKSLAQACARHCPVVVLAVVGEQFERTADERVQLVQEKIGHDTLSSLVILKQGCEVFERKPFIAHAHLYTGIENVLKTVVTVTDGGVFASGESYHAQLLAQAAQNTDKREPVVGQELYGKLDELRSFRHRERINYRHVLKEDLVNKNVLLLKDAFPQFESEVTAFIESWERRPRDHETPTSSHTI